MIELALMLRSIQSRFMVYKWTMATQFSFKYCIDPKDHKSEEKYKAITVEDAKNWLVQPCKTKEYHLNIKNLAALFVDNAFIPLFTWKCVLRTTNKIKMQPTKVSTKGRRECLFFE